MSHIYQNCKCGWLILNCMSDIYHNQANSISLMCPNGTEIHYKTVTVIILRVRTSGWDMWAYNFVPDVLVWFFSFIEGSH